MNREYVIVCNEHKSPYPGTLMFWGRRSQDWQPRSFGGYTWDIEKCERYTRAEIEKWMAGAPAGAYSFYTGQGRKWFSERPDVIITIAQLEGLGYKKATVMGL